MRQVYKNWINKLPATLNLAMGVLNWLSTFIQKNLANNLIFASIFDSRSSNSTSIHPFYDSASTRLQLGLGYKALVFPSMTNLELGPRLAGIWLLCLSLSFLFVGSCASLTSHQKPWNAHLIVVIRWVLFTTILLGWVLLWVPFTGQKMIN